MRCKRFTKQAMEDKAGAISEKLPRGVSEDVSKDCCCKVRCNLSQTFLVRGNLESLQEDDNKEYYLQENHGNSAWVVSSEYAARRTFNSSFSTV